MLKGMVGLEGVFKKWVPLREGMEIMPPALLLALLFPNVREIMVHCPLTVEGVPAMLRQRLMARLYWAPTVPQACFIVLLFLACICSIGKASEFLYFQF